MRLSLFSYRLVCHLYIIIMRLGKFSEFDGPITLPQRSSAFTGCAS